jgi:O-antigen/teichoic acid export membrane protein
MSPPSIQNEWRLLLRRLSAFGALPLVGSIAPLFVLPVISRIVEPHEWASLLSCQAIGSIAGLLVLSGWGVNGQAFVAATSSKQMRAAVYWASIRSRLALSVVTFPAAVIVGLAVTRGTDGFTSSLMVLSTAWSGFTLTWFAIGCGNANMVLRYDLVPRLAATLSSAVLIWTTHQVWIYPLALIVSVTIGLMTFHRTEFGTWFVISPMKGDAQIARSERFKGAALSIVGAAYAGAPLPLTQSLGLDGAAYLASTDRLYRYALFPMNGLANALQEWVLQNSGPRRRSSQMLAIELHLLLGIAGGACLALLGPIAGSWLFGDRVAPTQAICFGYGLAFLCVAVATPLVRNVLVPDGKTGLLLFASLSSGLLGVVLMVIFGLRWGAAGVSASLALADSAFLLLIAPHAFSSMKVSERQARVSEGIGNQ